MTKAVTRKPKANTIEAVADRAGVSTMTVSRVLRGTDNVASKTRDRVQAAMQELGYVHNRLAGALASSRSEQIAVIVPSVDNIVFTEVLAGVAAALNDSEFRPVIGISDYDAERELDLVRSLLAWRPAGFVMAHPQHSDETIRLLRASDVPVVELMQQVKEPIDMSYGLDHEKVGHETALHLLAKGYRRFGYLGNDHCVDVTSAARFKSFSETIAASGGEFVASLTVPVKEKTGISLGRTYMAELMQKSNEIQLAYFSNDAVAAGAMMYCLSEGMKIPEDIALASFSGLEIAGAMPIPITTVSSPRYDMGEVGATWILNRISNDEFQMNSLAEFELIPGKSS